MPLTLEYFYQHAKDKYKLSLLTPEVPLERNISWVHVLEDIITCTFIRGGELLITTGLETGEGYALFSLVQQSCSWGACGMILNTGMYINNISEELLNWCIENNFPLFSMPWEIHIADLAQDYCNEILSEKKIQELRNAFLLCSLTGKDTSEYHSIFSDFLLNYMITADHELPVSCLASVCHENNYYYICHELAHHDFTEPAPQTHCGISEQITQSDDLTVYIRQAYRSMQVSQIKNTGITHFCDIGLYNAALAIDDMDVLKSAEDLLAPLKDKSLRETFRLYLEKNGSVQEVAEALFLHRNTVNYRIQKGRSLLNTDSAPGNLEYLFAFYLCDCLELKRKFPEI